jgi:hypothetical protein
VVEAADFWKLDDVPCLERLDGSRLGRILVERKMRSRPVIIREVRSEQPPETLLIDNDDVIKKLPTNRSDQALDVRILPGRPGCGDHLVDAHVGNALSKTATEDRVAGLAEDSVVQCPTGTLGGSARPSTRPSGSR